MSARNASKTRRRTLPLRSGARTYAALFDLKSDPALRDIMTFEEGGERYSMYYLQPRSQEDLRRRNRAHRKIADFCFGLMGRTPDAFAGNLTGLSMKPEVFDSEPGGNQEQSAGDLPACAAQRPVRDLCDRAAAGRAQQGLLPVKGLPQPALRVTAEDDKGVTLNGMKMLASGAAYAHEVLVGNVMPLAPDQLKESITCVIPLNLPGLTLWSREPFNRPGMNSFDHPLTTRFDESDCMLVFKDAKVPWEKVIVHDNPRLSRNIYIQTAAHVISNHQSNVRFGSKLRFMLGVASLVTRFTGARDIPAVRDTLGRLAAMEAGYNAMIDGQIEACQPFDNGFVVFNRRYLYAAIHWAMENHSQLIDIMRELMGGGHFQFPASIDVLEDPELRELFETFWTAGEFAAADRMKLFKLAWDLVGSDHASRATSYEKFFVGPAFAVRNYNFINAPWDDLHAAVEGFMDAMAP